MTVLFALLVTIGLCLTAPEVINLARRSRGRLLSRRVRNCVAIARERQGVSPERLKQEARTAPWLARLILEEACRQGDLYEAPDGQYYVCRRQRLDSR
jgi:hypothetical protein